MPFWPQSWIVLPRMTCEPTCSLSHPILRAEKTDSIWYW